MNNGQLLHIIAETACLAMGTYYIHQKFNFQQDQLNQCITEIKRLRLEVEGLKHIIYTYKIGGDDYQEASVHPDDEHEYSDHTQETSPPIIVEHVPALPNGGYPGSPSAETSPVAERENPSITEIKQRLSKINAPTKKITHTRNKLDQIRKKYKKSKRKYDLSDIDIDIDIPDDQPEPEEDDEEQVSVEQEEEEHAEDDEPEVESVEEPIEEDDEPIEAEPVVEEAPVVEDAEEEEPAEEEEEEEEPVVEDADEEEPAEEEEESVVEDAEEEEEAEEEEFQYIKDDTVYNTATKRYVKMSGKRGKKIYNDLKKKGLVK